MKGPGCLAFSRNSKQVLVTTQNEQGGCAEDEHLERGLWRLLSHRIFWNVLTKDQTAHLIESLLLSEEQKEQGWKQENLLGGY